MIKFPTPGHPPPIAMIMKWSPLPVTYITKWSSPAGDYAYKSDQYSHPYSHDCEFYNNMVKGMQDHWQVSKDHWESTPEGVSEIYNLLTVLRWLL